MRRAAVTTLVLSASLLASLLPARAARAEEGGRRGDGPRQRIEFLVREARVLEAEGRTKAAHAFLERAGELERRARGDGDARRPTPLKADEARKVLSGLHAGIAALGHIHRPREQEALERIARELMTRMRAAGLDEKKAAEGPRAHERRKAERRERAGMDSKDRKEADRLRREARAKKRFALLQLAAEAYREADKGEAVERLELAMHALKLRLEGRRDDEAREIYGNAPSDDETRDLLRAASDLWAHSGHEEKAKALGAAVGGESDKPAKGDKAARRKAKARRESDRSGEASGTAKKLKRLSAQIERLAHGLKALQREVNELRKATTR